MGRQINYYVLPLEFDALFQAVNRPEPCDPDATDHQIHGPASLGRHLGTANERVAHPSQGPGAHAVSGPELVASPGVLDVGGWSLRPRDGRVPVRWDGPPQVANLFQHASTRGLRHREMGQSRHQCRSTLAGPWSAVGPGRLLWARHEELVGGRGSLEAVVTARRKGR